MRNFRSLIFTTFSPIIQNKIFHSYPIKGLKVFYHKTKNLSNGSHACKLKNGGDHIIAKNLVMKLIRSKSFLALLLILFIIGFSTSARTLMNYSTLLSFVSEEAGFSNELPGETNPHFAAYPVCLKEHRKQTKDYVKAYSENKRNYIIHIFNKGKKFFPKAIAILSEYEVPVELQMLPVLESEFNANAVSHAGAVGYWQFMSELAGEYGLRTGGKYDERKNFVKSTVAAAKFFRDQLDYFNDDILLAVASYNCGPGRVRLSIKKSGKSDADFWDVKKYLPSETRKFVMNFIALNVIAANYDKFIERKLDFNEARMIQFANVDSINNKVAGIGFVTADSINSRDSIHVKIAL